MASNARVLLRNASAAVYSRKNKTTHTSRGSVLSFIRHDSHKTPTLARASDEESPVPTSPDVLLIHAISSRVRVRGPKPPPSPNAHHARDNHHATHAWVYVNHISRAVVTRFVRVTDASSTPSSTRTRIEKIPAPSHASACGVAPSLCDANATRTRCAHAYVPRLRAKRVAAHARGHHRRARRGHRQSMVTRRALPTQRVAHLRRVGTSHTIEHNSTI